jgi:hypothetical protein
MTKQDKKRFLMAMRGLEEVFSPDRPVSDEKKMLYFRVFRDWTIEQFEQACVNIIKTKKISTFPLPAELKDAVAGDRGLKAWLITQEAVFRYGHNRSVQFPDPVIHSVIDAMGGWVNFCMIPTEELKWKQKEFERLYNTLENKKEHPQYLQGLCEIENRGRGYEYYDEIIKIDDKVGLGYITNSASEGQNGGYLDISGEKDAHD